MKKLFSTLLIAGIATAAFANADVKSVDIKQTETAKVSVAFHTVPQGTVIVRISDQQDRLILRDRITKTESFSKKYDLQALPEGIYVVEVMDQSGVLSKETVDTRAVEVAPTVFSRVSDLGGNRYRLVISNLEAKDIEVSIFDGNKLIHTEKVEDPQGLHKIYTISRPSAEGISFKVKTSTGFESFVSSL
jgi:hypothetical protein